MNVWHHRGIALSFALVGFEVMLSISVAEPLRDSVLINGVPAHPSRLLVKVKKSLDSQKAIATLAQRDHFEIEHRSELVPQLFVVDVDVSRVALKSNSTADTNGFLSSAIIEGLEYATKHGARLVNASFGGPIFSQAEYDAIAAAGKAGVLVVCATGNESQDNDRESAFPASYRLPNVLSVAAINRYGHLAEFSNYGLESVQTAAPGVDILSCGIANDTAYETNIGTSMAAPHVTGAAALILSRYLKSSALFLAFPSCVVIKAGFGSASNLRRN